MQFLGADSCETEDCRERKSVCTKGRRKCVVRGHQSSAEKGATAQQPMVGQLSSLTQSKLQQTGLLLRGKLQEENIGDYISSFVIVSFSKIQLVATKEIISSTILNVITPDYRKTP